MMINYNTTWHCDERKIAYKKEAYNLLHATEKLTLISRTTLYRTFHYCDKNMFYKYKTSIVVKVC